MLETTDLKQFFVALGEAGGEIAVLLAVVLGGVWLIVRARRGAEIRAKTEGNQTTVTVSGTNGKERKLSLQEHRDLCPLNREGVVTVPLCKSTQALYQERLEGVERKIDGVDEKVRVLFGKVDGLAVSTQQTQERIIDYLEKASRGE